MVRLAKVGTWTWLTVVVIALTLGAGLSLSARGGADDKDANSLGLLIAGGSLLAPNTDALVATLLPGAQQVGALVEGGPTQGDALSLAPDGQHAYLLDGANQPRAEWRLNELELPSLRVTRRTPYPDGINLNGRARIVAAARDGHEVYVETWHASGPNRFDPQLGVGQPDGTYGIAVFDVARGAFTRTLPLDAPWCGVAELYALADGRLGVLCTLGHQLRLIDPRLSQVVGRIGVTGEQGALSPDGTWLWVASRSGQVQEIDLGRLVSTRSVDVAAGMPARAASPCNGCTCQRTGASSFFARHPANLS